MNIRDKKKNIVFWTPVIVGYAVGVFFGFQSIEGEYQIRDVCVESDGYCQGDGQYDDCVCLKWEPQRREVLKTEALWRGLPYAYAGGFVGLFAVIGYEALEKKKDKN